MSLPVNGGQHLMQVEALLREGKLEEAVKMFDQILLEHPAESKILHMKAEALMYLGDWQSALACFDQMLTLDPADVSALLGKGELLMIQDRFEDAIAFYDQTLQKGTPNAAILRSKALALQRINRFEEALVTLERAQKLDPGDASTWIQIGDLQLEKGSVADAKFCFEQAINLGAENFGAADWTLRADNLYVSGKLEEAAQFYERALTAENSYASAWRGKGQVLRDRGEYEQALQCFTKALDLDDTHAGTWVDRAYSLGELNRLDEALKDYDEALKRDERHAIAWANRGVILERLGQFDLALDSYEKAIEFDKNNPNSWIGKGVCLGEKGKHEEAIACYDQAIKISDQALWAWNNKGWSLIQLKRLEDALPNFDTAIKTDSTETIPWINKGTTLRDLGRFEEAKQCLQDAAAVVTKPLNVLLELGSLLGDFIYDQAGALETYRKALQFEPDDPEILANIAECLIKAGRPAEGSDTAHDALGKTTDRALQFVLRFLIFVAHTLEKNFDARRREFPALVRELSDQFQPVEGWSWNGLKKTIAQSSSDEETKFLLLTLVDVISKKIPLASLSYFQAREESGPVKAQAS